MGGHMEAGDQLHAMVGTAVKDWVSGRRANGGRRFSPHRLLRSPHLQSALARSAGNKLRHLIEKHSRKFGALFARALAEEDVEVIHDLRVCSRRLQQCFDALYPDARPREVRRARRMLGRIRHAVGEWRNCDVALEILDRRRAEGRKRDVCDREKVQARRARQIDKARRRLRQEDLDRLAAAVRIAASRCGPGTDVRSRVRLGVERAWREWKSSLSPARADPSVRNVHALRIATKRLRYRVELARDLGERPARDVLPLLEELQDAIGRWHDRQVLRELSGRGTKRGGLRDSADLTEILASARRTKESGVLKVWTASV
jgi:CHAD domain-containing protein